MYTTPENDQIGTSEAKLARAVGASLVKCVVVICLTVLGGIAMHSCSVDDETIVLCQESCERSGNMKSVSRFSCTCQEIKNQSSSFVLDSKLTK